MSGGGVGGLPPNRIQLTKRLFLNALIAQASSATS